MGDNPARLQGSTAAWMRGHETVGRTASKSPNAQNRAERRRGVRAADRRVAVAWEIIRRDFGRPHGFKKRQLKTGKGRRNEQAARHGGIRHLIEVRTAIPAFRMAGGATIRHPVLFLEEADPHRHRSRGKHHPEADQQQCRDDAVHLGKQSLSLEPVVKLLFPVFRPGP